jgi:hypothetical protein
VELKIMKNTIIVIASLAGLAGLAYIMLKPKEFTPNYGSNPYQAPNYGYSNPNYGQFGYMSPNPDYEDQDFWENPNFWLGFSQTKGGQDLLGDFGNMIMPEISNILSLPSNLLGGLTSGFGLF